MATNIASLFVEIGLKSDKATNGLKSLSEQVKESQKNFNGLTEVTEALAVPMAGAAAGLAAVGGAIALTAGETVKYAEEVRQLSRELHVSSEEASTLIQIGDDLGVSQEALTRSFTIALQNGIRPNAEGLKDVGAQYRNIKDPIKQAEYAQKIFGRGWAEMIPLLRLTGDEFDSMAASMKGSALIMSDQEVQAARDYEIALDGLTDQVKGLQIAIGNKLIPVLTEAANALNLLLTADQQIQGALVTHNQTVIQTAGSYDDYVAEMKRAAQAAGLQIDAQGNLIKVTHDQRGSIETLIQSNFLLTASEQATAQAIANVGDERAENIGLIQQQTLAQIEQNAAGNESNLVFDLAIQKLRDFNIGEAQRIALEQELKLLSGEITQADIERSEAVGFLTKQLELGKITQGEYTEAILWMSANAAGARDIIADIGNKINGLPEFKEVNIRVNVNGQPAGAGDIGLGGDAPVIVNPENEQAPTSGGFQSGGSFVVPGSGTSDRLFGIGLTPGETVNVTPRGAGGGGSNQPIVIQLVTDGQTLFETMLTAAQLRGLTMVPVG